MDRNESGTPTPDPRTIGLLAKLPHSPRSAPDTTAIVLNWSRFPNVKRIAATLCAPELDGIIKEVFVWNNSPQRITYDDFRDTGCPRAKLRIHNSPENLYFQARFLACRAVETPYCFIQDDDFLITPDVIHTLHAALTRAPPASQHAIHLLPAHEHLSSSLRATHVPTAPSPASPLSAIHTGFAWLGHGTLLPRSAALAFLDLLHALGARAAEARMADNYFAVLGNRVPEVWFDQGVPLGGGVPFTVGAEGEERNNEHVARAADYLTAIAAGTYGPSLPYVSRGADAPTASEPVARAACKHTRCLLETNIALFPHDAAPTHAAAAARDMLALEAQNRARIGEAGVERYVAHPPSCAVDGRAGTFFLGACGAQAGDVVSLDFFDDVRRLGACAAVEMVWLVDAATAETLRACVLECSLDGLAWNAKEHAFACREILVDVRGEEARGAEANAAHQSRSLRECIFTTSVDPPAAATDAPTSESTGGVRAFRVKNPENRGSPWEVHNVYLRSTVEGLD